MKDFELQSIAEELNKTLSKRRCVAWIGSGLSIVGYPSWRVLIDKLCAACSVPQLAIGVSDPNQLADKADECKLANIDAYEDVLAVNFGKQPTTTRTAYGYLVQLPFVGYVTTNYDPLLSSSAMTTWCPNLFHYPDLPLIIGQGARKPIYHIHGLAWVNGKPNGKNLVLSSSEYRQAYDGIVKNFLEMLFTYHDVLFFGSRIGETEIRKTLARAINYQDTINLAKSTNEHSEKITLLAPEIVMSPDPMNQPVEDRVNTETKFLKEVNDLKSLGIKAVRYDPADKTHEEVEIILTRLCELQKVAVVPMSAFGLARGMPSP